MFCSRCGRNVRDGDRFCSACGHTLGAGPERAGPQRTYREITTTFDEPIVARTAKKYTNDTYSALGRAILAAEKLIRDMERAGWEYCGPIERQPLSGKFPPGKTHNHLLRGLVEGRTQGMRIAAVRDSKHLRITAVTVEFRRRA